MLNPRRILAAIGILTCFLLPGGARAGDSPDIDRATPASAAKAGWELTFSDEFDGGELDKAKWTVMDRKDREAANVRVSGGVMRLVTGKDGSEWTGAWVSTTTFRQKHGYFEAKFRLAAGPGLNNAFWLNTPPERLATPGKPDRFEIDIVEAHYPSLVHMTLHNWMGKHTASGAEHKVSANLSRDFHTYALEWDEKELTWYYDGKKLRTLKHTICKAEEQVLFSTKVMSWAGKPNAALEGKSMDVDYVRVYRKK